LLKNNLKLGLVSLTFYDQSTLKSYEFSDVFLAGLLKNI